MDLEEEGTNGIHKGKSNIAWAVSRGTGNGVQDCDQGDKNHIESVSSNMSPEDQEYFEYLIKNESYTIPISNYEAAPDTMLNVMGMLMNCWKFYQDKLVIETDDGDE